MPVYLATLLVTDDIMYRNGTAPSFKSLCVILCEMMLIKVTSIVT